MCATINRYEIKINKLDKETYPKLSNTLDDIRHYRDIYNYEAVNEIINELYKEFDSLVSLERKLVFPAVLSVFHKTNNHAYFPNITEIIQLTQSKDNKLKKGVENLHQYINKDLKKEEFSNFELEIFNLYNFFTYSYFPSKSKWISLLSLLTPESVNCENREKGACKCGSNKDNHSYMETSNNQNTQTN